MSNLDNNTVAYTTTGANDVLEQVTANGSARVFFKVNGYWSNSSIDVFINKSYGEQWTITESHSSGGEDNSIDITNAQRTRNFATAMLAAADIVEKWEGCTAELSVAYKEYTAELTARFEREAFERQEKARIDLENNPPMGAAAAAEVAENLKYALVTNLFASTPIYRRKDGTKLYATANLTKNGKVRFTLDASSVSRTTFEQKLATEYKLSE